MTLIITNQQFESEYSRKVDEILSTEPFHRGPAHAMKDDTTASTHELLFVSEQFRVPMSREEWQQVVKPNLPWAEDHFQERVGGKPLNPAPSEAWWPFARKNNAEHKDELQMFSHTYPERFWPKFAAAGEPDIPGIDFPLLGRQGIRFLYGDLSNLLTILRDNSNSRQAYLPIWFPEDLSAADLGERVPCSLGYHFMSEADRRLNCVYTLRSCDLVRFYRDDMYMAGRLLQLVAQQTQMVPNRLVVHINNLHCFPGDRPYLESLLPAISTHPNRSSYNFGAML